MEAKLTRFVVKKITSIYNNTSSLGNHTRAIDSIIDFLKLLVFGQDFEPEHRLALHNVDISKVRKNLMEHSDLQPILAVNTIGTSSQPNSNLLIQAVFRASFYCEQEGDKQLTEILKAYMQPSGGVSGSGTLFMMLPQRAIIAALDNSDFVKSILSNYDQFLPEVKAKIINCFYQKNPTCSTMHHCFTGEAIMERVQKDMAFLKKDQLIEYIAHLKIENWLNPYHDSKIVFQSQSENHSLSVGVLDLCCHYVSKSGSFKLLDLVAKKIDIGLDESESAPVLRDMRIDFFDNTLMDPQHNKRRRIEKCTSILMSNNLKFSDKESKYILYIMRDSWSEMLECVAHHKKDKLLELMQLTIYDYPTSSSKIINSGNSLASSLLNQTASNAKLIRDLETHLCLAVVACLIFSPIAVLFKVLIISLIGGHSYYRDHLLYKQPQCPWQQSKKGFLLRAINYVCTPSTALIAYGLVGFLSVYGAGYLGPSILNNLHVCATIGFVRYFVYLMMRDTKQPININYSRPKNVNTPVFTQGATAKLQPPEPMPIRNVSQGLNKP
tara:strand:+ start:11139 stop:12794 length:1656 start_codon:yes stop_codon:yes gene_type:complete